MLNVTKLQRAIYQDDGYVSSRSVSPAKKLIDSNKVFAPTGSSHMAAMLPTVEEAKIPAIVRMAPKPGDRQPAPAHGVHDRPDYDLAGYAPVKLLQTNPASASVKALTDFVPY